MTTPSSNLAGIIGPHPAGAAALVTGSGEVISYGSLRRAVAALQARLGQVGIVADDRVAIVSTNDPAFVVGYLAVLSAGAVAVPLNIASPPAELQRQLAQVDVSAILVGPGAQHLGAAIESRSGVPVFPLVAPVPPELVPPEPVAAGPTESAPPEPVARVSPELVARVSPELVARVSPELVSSEPVPPELVSPELVYAPVARRSDDLAALMFTAGTAGQPRAAMLTHGNLLANLDQVQRHPGRAIEATDRALGALPLCHIFGLNAVLGGALYAGGSVVLLERFDPARALEVIAQQRVTIVVGAPTLFAALAAAASVVDDPMASVRLALSGAAPLPPEVAATWYRRFGLPLRQGYGLTEASPVVTTAVMDEAARPGSIGVPVPGLEVRLVDDDGEPALAGDPGEIWVRGPNVFPGYWHDPEATKEALTPDGWLRTGDIAVVGDDGELAIVDRAKDLIIVSGFNVYPAEVEEVLAEHPAVVEVAVVGDVDRYRGEVVHAFVVVTGAAPTPAELKQWCAARLARYKCPTEITFVDDLPHGLAGKLLRRSLRSTATP